MTPPEAPVQGQDGRGTDAPPAVSFCETLRKRADFVRAAQARRHGTPGFLLQARRRTTDAADTAAIRVGFTCSRKLGNAVARNRAKRRLREIVRQVVPIRGRPGWDYVLVGRPGATATRDFAAMREELVRALERIHGGQR